MAMLPVGLSVVAQHEMYYSLFDDDWIRCLYAVPSDRHAWRFHKRTGWVSTCRELAERVTGSVHYAKNTPRMNLANDMVFFNKFPLQRCFHLAVRRYDFDKLDKPFRVPGYDCFVASGRSRTQFDRTAMQHRHLLGPSHHLLGHMASLLSPVPQIPQVPQRPRRRRTR